MDCRLFLKHVRLCLAALAAAGWLSPLTLPGANHPAGAFRPNIVYILADDLGYGDVHCLNPERGKIPTPNLDRLAAQGIRFTDAHSGSAVCTPTRYGILTGRYAWRSRLQSGVLLGFSPPLIDKERLTVPRLLKQHGYQTACIGKWHLGLTFAGTGSETNDLTQPIQDGPTTRGFDYYFGISASLDMPPFAFIENDQFTETPSVEKQWLRKGAAAPGFEAVDVLPTLTRKAVEYLGGRAAEKKPFFLYLALTSPHTPIVPPRDWEGKSGLSAYGDFVMQTDWSVAQVLQALEKNGLAENTLVIFTSDNGCSPAANVQELESKGHYPSYLFRGYKADIWDGGHHIPFFARWPGHIRADSVSDQLTCLTDLMATCADLLGIKLPDDAGEDSVSLLPALLGRAAGPLREAVVHHSINGSFALRQGKWKLELCPDSGGWSAPKPGSAEAKKLPPVQLYDMAADIGEHANTQKDHPEIVARLTKLLEKYVTEGRSTAGRPLRNDEPVNIWKSRASGAGDKSTQTKKDINYDESKVGSIPIPDPLMCEDGTKVSTADQWLKKRRPEVLRLLEREVYGKTPEGKLPGTHMELVSENKNALGGKATMRQVALSFSVDPRLRAALAGSGGAGTPPTNASRPLKVEVLLYLPNARKHPAPVFVSLNFGGNHSVANDPAIRLGTGWFRNEPKNSYPNNKATEQSRGAAAERWPLEAIIARGYGVATAYYGDLEPDHAAGIGGGVRPLYFKRGQTAPADDEWGAIGAWAWGLSRMADYLTTLPEVDGKRLAVLGHSRLGKTALWAGAQDERFGIVISNDSGAGGAALSKRIFGETVAVLNRNFPHWFCGNFKKYSENEAALPVDQHELVALIAPRPVYIASATEDLWADPKGEFLGGKLAEPAYALFGKQGLGIAEPPAPDTSVGDFIGYHARTGKHDILLFDWERYMDFADRHWGKPE